MEVNRAADQSNKIHDQLKIKKLDQRHEELRIEEMRIRARLRDNEEKRIEMNREMNRPGQNIDKMV
jgi:hypothetical protein